MDLYKKNTKEIIDQIVRLVVGGWKSFIDQVPLGNTSGVNVSPLKHMTVPEDINALFNTKRKIRKHEKNNYRYR